MNSVNKNIWRCWYLCRTKLHFFKALILAVLLYGSETWTLSSTLESHLDAFYNKSLRRIIGYNWQDHVSSRWTYRETGMGPVTCITRDRQLRLYRRLARFPVDGPANQVVSSRDNPDWRRPVGRI
ncbi:uncharacterized protein [Penaeus vannamei]|uniref:uncharacterized protein n=1 Tax=Penaeus vannamei TaxID=6689 RepID=UPI00387F7331